MSKTSLTKGTVPEPEPPEMVVVVDFDEVVVVLEDLVVVVPEALEVEEVVRVAPLALQMH